MQTSSNSNFRCFLAVPIGHNFEPILRAIQKAVREAEMEPVSLNDLPLQGIGSESSLFAELARADIVIADVTSANANVFFEIGQAFAMAKGIILLAEESDQQGLPLDVRSLNVVGYQKTKSGLEFLQKRIVKELHSVRHGARRARALPNRSAMPFFVDWGRLDLENTENLCREMLLQMGYRNVDWNKNSSEFDIVADLPKKDPDGYEYNELWAVSLGRNAPVPALLEMADHDPDMLMHRLLRDDLFDEKRRYGRIDDVSLTLLFILFDKKLSDYAKEILDRFRRRGRSRKFPSLLRIRVWNQDYMTNLVQQFPQLGYKYFSDEARSLARFRKGPEELYQENVLLTERLGKTVKDLEAERNLRVRAERDAVWKDISFSAAHKIGNPIFAIETDLDPLIKRIRENRADEAIEVTDNMRCAVEKAKAIVDQFKSLSKAQHIETISMELLPTLKDACRTLHGSNAICKIECDPRIMVTGDPERLQEVFDELAANASHWVRDKQAEIRFNVELPSKEKLPQNVDSSKDYALVKFQDNGTGVPAELKERIFEPFFTTYDQGTGLGLALVRRIVEGHEGFVRETGLLGRGAEFEVYLPVSKQK